MDGQGDPVIGQLCIPHSRLAKEAWLTLGVVAVLLLLGFTVHMDHTCRGTKPREFHRISSDALGCKSQRMPLAKHQGNVLECLENCRAWPTEADGVAARAPLRPEEQGAGPPKGMQVPVRETVAYGQ